MVINLPVCYQLFTNKMSSDYQPESEVISSFDPGDGEGGQSGGNGAKDHELGDEVLTNQIDVQVYEELLARIGAEVVISEPIISRNVVDERIKKINVKLDDDETCQMVILSDLPVNNAWSSFRYPRNYNDFLEIVFSWADNHVNDHNWPQEDIITRLKTHPHSMTYNSFKSYLRANLSHLLVIFYDRLKKDIEKLGGLSQRVRVVGSTVSKIEKKDQWAEITLQLNSSGHEDLKFGYCCLLTVIQTLTHPKRRYFGSILGKETVKENGVNVTNLVIRSLEFIPIVGDELAVTPLFRIHQIYTAAECLFEIENSDYMSHFVSPNLASAPAGVTVEFEDESNLDDFDCDAVYKAVDTLTFLSPESSPICCLDFRETEKSLKDVADIVIQTLINMRTVPLDIRRVGLDMPTMVICNDEEVLSVLHEKFKKADFSIYRLNKKGEPANLREKIPKIGKVLAQIHAKLKLSEDWEDYEDLVSKWELVDEGISIPENQERKFNELIQLAKVFALRNSAVLLGNIYDVANDIIVNSSYCRFDACIILGASSIPEVFSLSLMKYECEKFILIDRETTPWPGNKSLFARLTTIYENDYSLMRGAKCAIVSRVKKRQHIPEPPKDSRHKLIENKRESASTSGTSSDYNPEQRKNPRVRQPYCPRPTTIITGQQDQPKDPSTN